MDWLKILSEVFEVCIIPLLGLATAYFIKFIKKKAEQLAEQSKNDLIDKYIYMASDTIAMCVKATNQTYVETLKKEGKFDAEAQKEAFKMTFENVKTVLSEEAQKYLAEFYGDINAYLTEEIEAQVNKSKIQG